MGSGTIRQKYSIREILSDTETFTLAGLVNMHPSLPPTSRSNAIPATMNLAIWKLEDEIKRKGPMWFGYWDADRYVKLSPRADDVAVAGFLLPGREALLRVANLRHTKKELSVALLGPTGLADKTLVLMGRVCGEEDGADPGQGALRMRLSGNSFIRVMMRAGQ